MTDIAKWGQVHVKIVSRNKVRRIKDEAKEFELKSKNLVKRKDWGILTQPFSLSRDLKYFPDQFVPK